LTTVLRTGRDQLGPGRYETLLHPGDLDGPTPYWRLKACENANGEAYPTLAAIEGNAGSVSWSRRAAVVRRHQVRYAIGSRPGKPGHPIPDPARRPAQYGARS
jgi:hypothetical protein